MGAISLRVAAVTCDIIDSRRYTGVAREKLHDAVARAFKTLTDSTPALDSTKLDVRVTAGDEFQFVLRKSERALDVVMALRSVLALEDFRPMVRFRAAVGVGEATFRPAKRPNQRPYEWDGPAFVYAREGLEAIQRQWSPDRWTALRTSNTASNLQFDVILGLVDRLQRSWTIAQWEAIAWTLKGLSRQETARHLGVRHQNVSKRLSAAGWAAVDAAMTFVRESLSSPLAGPKP